MISETAMWAVYEAAPTLYIARLILTDPAGDTKATRTFIDEPSLELLRKTLKAKGLEPLVRVEETEIGALEYWV